MDGSAPTPQKAGVSDYLAAERTLLAWIRTGLAMMAIRVCGGALRTLPPANPGHADFFLRTALRVVSVVRHSTDCRWSHRERLCGMAPYSIGPSIRSRRNITLSSFDPGCRSCFLSGIGRFGNGHLPRFDPQFRSSTIRQQQGDIHDAR